MKKLLGSLLILGCLCAAMPTRAQVGFGVKGGLNLSASPTFSFDEAAIAENYDNARSHTGFFFGPMVECAIPVVGLGLDAAVMYSQKGNLFDGKTMKQKGLEIPVNLKYSISLGSMAGAFATIGPSAYFNLKSDNILKDLDNITQTIDYSSVEFAFNVGVGLKLLDHVQAGVSYSLPLTDSADIITKTIESAGVPPVVSDVTYKSNVWQVSVAYVF